MAVLIHRRITQTANMPGLATKIQQAQEASGLSVTEACRRIGISRTYWYKLINDDLPEGMAEPTFRKIEEVLGVDFGVSFDD
ncbi:MAG: helix-turn-helix transcriptional regulator [Nostoc sp. NMS2]|uniref:helix-turn-helix domain-containing protein n=1 Tax=Nostoc sp. NMS2 TaxID=2815389 RepID=UPI0025E49787|nr:helix-turn-helix transcriptional regulator [Nostoc sp. NMS2]MBN3993855.1 helix-turn-helix transcriptional regulator [Nostoc sp. NMS2]